MIKRLILILILNVSYVSAQKKDIFIPQAKIEYDFITNLDGLDEFKCVLYFNETASYFSHKQTKNSNTTQKKAKTNDYDKAIVFKTKTVDTSNHYIYTNRKERKRIATVKRPDTNSLSLVKDTLAIIKWKLVNETKLIGNFNCKKATAHFKGRDYTAWYTTKINTFFGPLKFGQLPGLILELYDTNKKIFIQVTKIAYPYNTPVTINTSYSYITEQELIQLKKEAFDKYKKEKETQIDAVLSKFGRNTKLSKIKVEIKNDKTETIETKTED